jgi:hypothetical protein
VRLAVVLTGLLAVAPAKAGEITPDTVLQVAPATSSIRVDAKLDDAGWDGALKLDLPFEFRPGENTPAPVRTECWITHDARSLYVGFRASDPEPRKIRAHLADRDTAFRDDFVGIILDTYGDRRRAYEFFVNPLGAQADGLVNDVGSGEDFAWDAIWDSAGRITEEGYEVEIEIPFNAIRFPRTDGIQRWGFHASRSYPRSVRHQLSITPIDRNRNCWVCQFPSIEGFAGITPGRNLELDPTLTLQRTDAVEGFFGGPLVQGGTSIDPGLTTRWGFTPGMSLNATINPDFSQVEADVLQLDVNTRFALFYPEKRPFFLEGADFFETLLPVVYTRSMADPGWGLKVAGKDGPHAVGVLAARDNQTNLIFPSNQGSRFATLPVSNTSSIVRYRGDVANTSTAGVLLTDREDGDYFNRVAGTDGLFRFTENDRIEYQALWSSTSYPARIAAPFDQPFSSFRGHSWRGLYVHETRNWYLVGAYEDRSPGFRADLGFMPRVDTKTMDITGGHLWYGAPGAFLTEIEVGAEAYRIEDHAGTLTDQDVHVFTEISGPLQSYLEMSIGRQKERFAATLYDKTVGNMFFNIRPTGDFTCSLFARYGDQIDYENSRPGTVLHLEPGLTYDIRHLRLQLDHIYERLNVQGGQLYRADLTRMRLMWLFNLRTFVRAIVQVQDLSRDPGLYLPQSPPWMPPPARERNVWTQFLFSYKLNPQTVVFAGYGDARAGTDDLGLGIASRSFFLKLGYAWLL